MDKERERSIVEGFLLSHGYPVSALREWDRERPDALVEIDGRLIGVEVTELAEATPRQAIPPQMWKSEARRVVRDAQVEFEKRHPVALVVSIAFRLDWHPQKNKAKALASEIVRAIEASVPLRILASNDHFDPMQLRDPDPAVSRVYVGPTSRELGGLWKPLFGGEVRRATAHDVFETVRRKQVEVAAHEQVTPIVWLLIDCDLAGQGIALDLPDLSGRFTVPPGFDRVFCCEFSRMKWAEILVATS